MSNALGNLPDPDVEAIFEAATKDSRQVELRPKLPELTDAGIVEFLGDISSFANAEGGQIIYGLEITSDGSFVCHGVDVALFEKNGDRLRRLIIEGLDPVLSGVEFLVVPARQGRVVIVDIPRSRAAPHMVVFQQYCRFLSRNGRGKYLLDVSELRTSFSRAAVVGNRLHHFHLDRIQVLLGRSMSIQLPPAPKVVLHMLPLRSFQDPPSMSLEEVSQLHSDFMRPMDAHGINTQFNWDGLMMFSSVEKYAYSHFQLFRNGCLEACNGSMLEQKDDLKLFPASRFEPEVITCGNRMIELLRRLQIEPPYVARLSFLGVKGYSIFVGPLRWQPQIHKIEHDHLFLDDVIVERSDVSFSRVMRPAFDRVWNASGWPRSMNYDAEGNWREFGT